MILRLEKTRLESEQEPPFGGTGSHQTCPVLAHALQQNLNSNTSLNNLIKPVWELGLEGFTYEGGQFDTSEDDIDEVLKMPWF